MFLVLSVFFKNKNLITNMIICISTEDIAPRKSRWNTLYDISKVNYFE